MKYGVLFSTVAALLATFAIDRQEWYWLLLWPAISCVLISAGYFRLGPKVYGKCSNGSMSPLHQFLLLPMLLYLWSAWYLLRLIKREPAFHQLTESIYIGRRLLAHEYPQEVNHVIDLTCEFSEVKLPDHVQYHSFSILDGYVPDSHQLLDWVQLANSFDGILYIHCAEGHGRTGLFAAAMLLSSGEFSNCADALQFIQSKRPLVRLGRRQQQCLIDMFECGREKQPN